MEQLDLLMERAALLLASRQAMDGVRHARRHGGRSIPRTNSSEALSLDES
jgi:hypothetical protein